MEEFATLPSCSGGYEWATGTAGEGGELRWAPTRKWDNGQGGGDWGGAGGGGGCPPAGPMAGKQAAHACVRSCAPWLAGRPPATPACVGAMQRKQIRNATSVAGCTERLD